MAEITQPSQRTFVYKDSFFQIDDGVNNDRIKFIQDWEFLPSMDDFDIDNLDDATPIFTPKSDILGTFSFNPKNAIDIYDTANDSDDLLTATAWMLRIKEGNPAVITFITILTAFNDGLSTHGKVTLQWTGRIMNPGVTQTRNTGVQELIASGEITDIVVVQRTPGS